MTNILTLLDDTLLATMAGGMGDTAPGATGGLQGTGFVIGDGRDSHLIGPCPNPDPYVNNHQFGPCPNPDAHG